MLSLINETKPAWEDFEYQFNCGFTPKPNFPLVTPLNKRDNLGCGWVQ